MGVVNIEQKVGWAIHSLRVLATDISEVEEISGIYQNLFSSDT